MSSFRLSLALAALLILPAPVIAADLVAPEAAAPVAAPSYIWSGPYAGAFVGYNFANFDQSRGADFDGEGFVGGIYTGFNLQTNQFVYGIEADVGASGLDAGGYDTATGAPISADANAFGSLRARVGVAYDPFLFFATGGLAVANAELSSNGDEDSNTHFGYTLGAGVEAQVTGNVSTRVEYRYSDYGSKTYDLGPVSTSTGFDEHSIRAGVALKF
jgi:outer membrane immunogenic protein